MIKENNKYLVIDVVRMYNLGGVTHKQMHPDISGSMNQRVTGL